MTPDPARLFDAVVFDFSGVLITSAFEVLAKVLDGQLPADETLELLLGPYDRDTDHPWHRVERGELAMGEWFAHVDAECRSRGLAPDWAAMRAGFGAVEVVDAMVDRIRGLRSEGYATAVLTNNVREFADGWRALLPLDELFDAVVDSSEVGLRKPDPRIYLLTLERLGGVSPGRAVFLDDHPGNVAGARAAGLAALLVDDPVDAIGALDAVLSGAAA